MKRKPFNNLQYAIWIDQKKAIIACRDEAGKISTESLPSSIDAHPRFDGETTNKVGLFGATINHEKKIQHHWEQQRKLFLKDVAAHLSKVSSLIIMGPATTKYALYKELEKKKAFEHTRIELRTVDKMKLHEIRAVLSETAKA
ncbi:MAG: hypothetical protein KGO81_10015 [Bacteroidota bacterium]|nr:hypothetical protein [Bacteroidota bacterium]